MSKRNSKRTITISLNLKKVWELPRGHEDHLTGTGIHDNRPKRLRTRGAANRKAMREYED